MQTVDTCDLQEVWLDAPRLQGSGEQTSAKTEDNSKNWKGEWSGGGLQISVSGQSARLCAQCHDRATREQFCQFKQSLAVLLADFAETTSIVAVELESFVDDVPFNGIPCQFQVPLLAVIVVDQGHGAIWVITLLRLATPSRPSPSLHPISAQYSQYTCLGPVGIPAGQARCPWARSVIIQVAVHGGMARQAANTNE
ncbi:hypothetical protein Cob_v004702 [Colletotrichum orbiculare MAFF 240422]|uniref:Uncharacterized protein n=1 Tax=Colletotrichum orbiculare (strain 104-T / ATCC 96160 / CBS 514.97 / LARS 414 / MAFF 240422) TaxID=1213857 RepID=A0A484FXT2_COLOR|nr:hypothetical protein Cob_v004702 [Colletotrichum orbiculare MAFF 240422]